MRKNKDFITLKEAAEISGYSQDYLGQLIRMGKLPGKQIYYNVAWVTTEEALREYMTGSRDKKAGYMTDLWKKSQYPMLRFLSGGGLDKTMGFFMRLGVAITVVLTLLTFYIISASIESRFEKRALNALIIEEIELNQDEK